MPQVFRVVWLDIDHKELPNLRDEYILKDNKERAIASIGSRCYQYPHKVPQDAAGFVVIPVDSVLNE